MVARRALNFTGNTPSKRMRPNPAVVYRTLGVKPEMKHATTTIAHTTTASDQVINEIANGAGNNQRIGSKIKIHGIEVCLTATTATVPYSLDIVLPNDASTAPTTAYGEAINRQDNALLRTVFLTPNGVPNTRGYKFYHKLPYGIVARYSSTAGASINDNAILCHLTSQSNITIVGYYRIWYTDA